MIFGGGPGVILEEIEPTIFPVATESSTVSLSEKEFQDIVNFAGDKGIQWRTIGYWVGAIIILVLIYLVFRRIIKRKKK